MILGEWDFMLFGSCMPPFLPQYQSAYIEHMRFKEKLIYFYRVGKGERRRGREISMCGCLLPAPQRGPGPQPRHIYALTGNWTSNPLLRRPVLNPVSYTSHSKIFLKRELKSCPGQCGWVGWATACKAEGHQFDSWSGRMPRLGLVAGGACARGNQSMFLSHIGVFLPLFLPSFPLSKNK